MVEEEVAEILLQAAVAINSKELFTYTSGIRSPIYCDLRVLIDSPEQRSRIVDLLCESISRECDVSEVDVVAGVATSGVPWAAWVAERLDKRMAYVRESRKEHGKGQKVEGRVSARDVAIVIEDHISTGGSAIEAAKTLKEDLRAKVDHCFSIFTYDLPQAKQAFRENSVEPFSLCTVETLLQLGTRKGKLSQDDAKAVRDWRAIALMS
jgi:orotate phosphoribosyltransferase